MAGENWDKFIAGLHKIGSQFQGSGNMDNFKQGLSTLTSSTGPDWMNFGSDSSAGAGIQKQLQDWIKQNQGAYDAAQKSEGAVEHSGPQGVTMTNSPNIAAAVGKTAAGKAASGAGAGSKAFISPLAIQLFFSKAIAPLLQQISGEQSQAIDQFKAAGGKVDPRQLASMQNVNHALAGAAVAAPAVDALMGQVNQVLNAQNKAYYEAMRANALGTAGSGADLLSQLGSLGLTNPSGG